MGLLALGLGRYALPLIIGTIGGYLVLRGMEQEPEAPTARLVGLAIVFVVFLVLASLIVYQRDESYADLYAVARAGAGGGYIGSVIGTALGRLLGGPGTIVPLVVVGALSRFGVGIITGPAPLAPRPSPPATLLPGAPMN